ncbi:uncharacterized protein EV422DRAFT_523913 [Fimicolochytrium jonesii]|uniref:uncharacterized protein n=1 Tax=Fimicolochytrium jonesii TaxID=1396493 RepID=UPI0022FF1853|nr:uncharacterized protein EV422DRAFT_523913 [Fimicolochytrium jonesii]KAI8822408.1 hypothetical protein EV422DRAFT_523913 [Fimicolochytrium jonesii]
MTATETADPAAAIAALVPRPSSPIVHEPILTARLRLLPISSKHLDGAAFVKFFAGLYANPAIGSLAGFEPSIITDEKQVSWRANMAGRFEKFGYGTYAVFELHDSEYASPIGALDFRSLGAYKSIPDHPKLRRDETEVAYFYDPIAWGKGYATEALLGVLDDIWIKGVEGRLAEGFPVLEFVSASAVPGHPQSHKILQKCGLKPVEGTLGFNKDDEVYYRVYRDEWVQGRKQQLQA